jgi:hypothetical protein
MTCARVLDLAACRKRCAPDFRGGAREAIEKQIDDLDRKFLKLARHDAQIRRFMTVVPSENSIHLDSRHELESSHHPG